MADTPNNSEINDSIEYHILSALNRTNGDSGRVECKSWEIKRYAGLIHVDDKRFQKVLARINTTQEHPGLVEQQYSNSTAYNITALGEKRLLELEGTKRLEIGLTDAIENLKFDLKLGRRGGIKLGDGEGVSLRKVPQIEVHRLAQDMKNLSEEVKQALVNVKTDPVKADKGGVRVRS